MAAAQALTRIEQSGIVAIVRLDAAAALVEVGVARLGDRAVLGAGTVLDAETARLAIQAGGPVRRCREPSPTSNPGLSPPILGTEQRPGALI